MNLGRVALAEKDYASAAESLKKSIQCDPNQFLVHEEMAVALFKIKQYDKSMFHVHESLRLKPGYLKALNSLAEHAWLKATSKIDEFYDPPKALELVRQAMDKTPKDKRTAALLKALAAAQAANGNFTEAIETARQAVQLAMSKRQKQTAREIQIQIRLYKNKTPYRQ